MTNKFDRRATDRTHSLDATLDRLREADEKLTRDIRSIVYESRGHGGDDHAQWNNERSRDSSHAAPQKIAEEWKRIQRRSAWWTLFWIVALLGACGWAIWAILNLKF